MNKTTKKIAAVIASVSLLLNMLVSPAFALEVATPTAPATPSIEPATPTAPALPSWMQPETPVDVTQNQTTQAAPSEEQNRERRERKNREKPVNVQNSENGSGSANKSAVDVIDSTAVEQTNTADVVNNLDAQVKTGNNEADKNMGDAQVTSGDASVAAALMNDINNNHITIGDLCGLGCSEGFVAENLKNGNGTLNNADGSLTNLVYLNNANYLSLANNVDLGAYTGGNSASKNMGDGIIVSGDADIVFNTVNFGNNNFVNTEVVTFNILDDQSEDLWINFPEGAFENGSALFNGGNGADSVNDANVATTRVVNIDGTNDLILDNNISLSASTGNNDASKNMGSGDITTGDVNIVSNLINFLNNSIVDQAKLFLASVNIFGNMSGDIILPREADLEGCGCIADVTAVNTGNGADSLNTASTSLTDETDINQINNATINTNLNLNANTGGNEAEKNMGTSSITTGDVNVNSNLVTVANTNTVGAGDTWWLVIVNNQGNYTGKIIGAEDGAMIDGSGLEFGINPDGSVYALNDGNGAGSQNNASTQTNSSTTINQTNNAVINNNISIDANTGNNTANYNMDGASVKTGDVNVASNIVNFVNNNIVGKNLLVVFVNVFGSFTGNIVPPDQEIPAKGGVGGPADENGLASGVSLPANTTLSSPAKKAKSASLLRGSNNLPTNLGEALEEGGKLLEKAASTQNSVTEIVGNSSQKSAFAVNYLLIGGALLIIAGYVIISRRRAS